MTDLNCALQKKVNLSSTQLRNISILSIRVLSDHLIYLRFIENHTHLYFVYFQEPLSLQCAGRTMAMILTILTIPAISVSFYP